MQYLSNIINNFIKKDYYVENIYDIQKFELYNKECKQKKMDLINDKQEIYKFIELLSITNIKLFNIKQKYEIQCKINSTITDKNKELTQLNEELIILTELINVEIFNIKQENQKLIHENKKLINSTITDDSTITDNLCVICYENRINHVVIPCGHVFSCEKCIVKINKCSICRIPILNKHKIFI
jgi:hypothetical protein